MKFYNPNELFVGQAGHCDRYTKQGQDYLRFIGENYTIIKKIKTISIEKYTDILSKVEYIYFKDSCCTTGDSTIYHVKPFSLFILGVLDKFSHDELISTLGQKILNNESISEKELTKLIYRMNNLKVDVNSYNKNSIIKEYINIINEQEIKFEPTQERDDEIKNILISLAQNKKNPLLIGNKGTGKSSIINHIIYKIQKNQIPDFLKNKKIFDITRLITSDKYCESFNEEIKEFMDKIVANNDIIFIDNIHLLHESDKFIIDLINQYIDQKNLKIIGTTNLEDYNKYINNTTLNNYLDKIEIKEPEIEKLHLITENILYNYSNNNNINIFDIEQNNLMIIEILIRLTRKENRIPFDNMCNKCEEQVYNPGLITEIIDKIFAEAKANNQKKLTKENLFYGIKSCNKIDDKAKTDFIVEINDYFIEEPELVHKPNFITKILRKKKN